MIVKPMPHPTAWNKNNDSPTKSSRARQRHWEKQTGSMKGYNQGYQTPSQYLAAAEDIEVAKEHLATYAQEHGVNSPGYAGIHWIVDKEGPQNQVPVKAWIICVGAEEYRIVDNEAEAKHVAMLHRLHYRTFSMVGGSATGIGGQTGGQLFTG